LSDAIATAYYEAMSPSLLANEPAAGPTDEMRPGADWEHIYGALEGRMNALRMWRISWWQHWASLAENLLPKRYHWLITANIMNRGHPLNNHIVDSTATLAMQVCASGMWTGLTSPSRPWFKLGIALPWVELDAAGLAWLSDTEQRVYAVLGAGNFYNTMAQAFQDVASFGTAPVIIYEDFEDVIRCYLPCSGEYYLAVGARQSVDTLYREFTMTVQAIVEMFGLDNCPLQVVNLWEAGGGSLENEFIVAHAIEPNTAMLGRGMQKREIRVVPGSFTYREVYWLKGIRCERELSRRGFVEKPFFAARWSVTSNDAYGRSPGMDCLGDTKQLQQETRRKGEYIEKLVRPPMGADAEMKNEPSSILPGHVTYTNTANSKKGFWPLFEMSPAALPPMVEDIKEIQLRIEKCFFVDVFMAISRMEGVQPRNELELTKRDLERLQVLGPFVELFEVECAGPAIMRVLAILERRKMLRPRPRSMANMPLKLEYMSMLKLAQRASETANMERTFAVAGSLSAAAKAAGVADPIRIINLDESFRIYADLLSFTSRGLFSADEVAEHDKARQAELQKQQMMAATTPAVDAAHTLSQTPIGGGQSALTAMLGGAGGR
jgi:hypothetical protein